MHTSYKWLKLSQTCAAYDVTHSDDTVLINNINFIVTFELYTIYINKCYILL